jgi:hypothetical protein
LNLELASTPKFIVQYFKMSPFKLVGLFYLAVSTLHGQSFADPHTSRFAENYKYPMQNIAGVDVIDTPLVRDAQSFALAHSTHSVYNHMMRSWLLGAIVVNANATLRDTVDLEVQALASILHDLGLDPTKDSPIVSPDKRFEVDGATAARNFVQTHEDGQSWSEVRLQLLWDSIALHATFGIADYKQPEVELVSEGAVTDFLGPQPGITSEEFNALLEVFPREDFETAFNTSMIRICRSKPNTTYGERRPRRDDESYQHFLIAENRHLDAALGRPLRHQLLPKNG